MPPIIVACTEAEALSVRSVALASYQEAKNRDWPFLSDVLERTARLVAEDERAVLTAVVHALVKYDRLLEFATGAESLAARFDALLSLARGETAEVDARIARIEPDDERLGVAFSL